MTDEPINVGGPAFAIPASEGNYCLEGMSQRAWFAGKALAGLCAYSGSYGASNGPAEIAARAYQIADAMIEIETETANHNHRVHSKVMPF